MWPESIGENLLHGVLAELGNQAIALRITLENVNGFVQPELADRIQVRARPSAQLEHVER
jgi:hypothetical protein